jgi:hypothetical protein
MRRIASLAAAILLIAAVGAPAVLAADDQATAGGRVLMAFNGDISVPAGEHADVVFVANGDADIAGSVDVLTVIDGTATLHGATLDTVVVISGTVDVQEGTVVTGDIRSIESTVNQAQGVQIGGEVKGLDAELLALGMVIGPAILLFMIGLFLASIVAGLLLAAVAPRQVRAAERVIAAEALPVFGVGLLSVILIPILAVVAIITIVGAPLGIGVLFGALPLLAFVGFLVAAIFVGERILGRQEPVPARPYRGALVGIVVLQLIGVLPFVGGLVTGVASLMGIGAIVLLAWRTVRGPGETVAPQPAPPAPMAIGA